MRWIALVALAACTIHRDVLVEPLTSCVDALAGESGQACAFDGSCSRPSPSNATCCTESAYCRGGETVVAHDCNPDCTPCANDVECKAGSAICNGTVCEPCPLAPCVVCPAGWVYLQRNGCATCDCAPAPTCDAHDTAPSCPTAVSKCYAGAECGTGCSPADSGCCSDQCAGPGCTGPVPAGCIAPCGASQTGCTTCATDHCSCIGGAWQCTVICANGHHASCAAPP
jgi:hypothetical protein